MQQAEIDNLRQDVRLLLDRMEDVAINERYRCYEYARKLREGLDSMGYEDLVVGNGLVKYEANFLRRACTPREVQVPSLDLELAKICKTEALHSWLQVGNILVNYHPHLQLTRSFGVGNLLLMHVEDEVRGQVTYIRRGGEIYIGGTNLIYYPPFYVTRLRI